MQPSVMVCAHGVRVMTSTNLQRLQNPAMSKASQGIGDWNYKSQQDLLKAKYPNMDPNFSLGDGPQTPQAAIPTGVFPSPEASPLPSPHPREIPLSTVSCISNPVFGDAAFSQKLAASWLTNQHYGDAVDQVGTLHAALTRPVSTCRAAANVGHKVAPSLAASCFRVKSMLSILPAWKPQLQHRPWPPCVW